MSISIETQGRVRIVTIERPEARNAVNPEVARALFEAFMAFEADERVDVGVLTGAGGHFCAGYDLKAAAGASGAEWLAQVDIPKAGRMRRSSRLQGRWGHRGCCCPNP